MRLAASGRRYMTLHVGMRGVSACVRVCACMRVCGGYRCVASPYGCWAGGLEGLVASSCLPACPSTRRRRPGLPPQCAPLCVRRRLCDVCAGGLWRGGPPAGPRCLGRTGGALGSPPPPPGMGGGWEGDGRSYTYINICPPVTIGVRRRVLTAGAYLCRRAVGLVWACAPAWCVPPPPQLHAKGPCHALRAPLGVNECMRREGGTLAHIPPSEAAAALPLTGVASTGRGRHQRAMAAYLPAPLPPPPRPPGHASRSWDAPCGRNRNCPSPPAQTPLAQPSRPARRSFASPSRTASTWPLEASRHRRRR